MASFRSFFFISILYFTSQCNRGIFCAEDDNTVLKNVNFDSQSTDVVDNEFKEVIRSGRELRNLDPDTSADNLTDEERSARGLLGSRRHLKKSDADRVATYFLNDGPLIGKSHFLGPSDSQCATSGDGQNNIVGTSDPSNGNYKQSSKNENNLNTQLYNPLLGIPHTLLSAIPGAVHNANPYISAHAPTIGRLNSILGYPYTKLRTRARNAILGSVLRTSLHPYIHELRNIPHTLLRAAAAPVHGILNAPSLLNHWVAPYSSYRQNENILGRANTALQGSPSGSVVDSKCHDEKDSIASDESNSAAKTSANEPENNDTNAWTSIQGPRSYASIPVQQQFVGHPQPTGYIVKYVPHYGQNLPASPYVSNPASPYNHPYYGASIVGAARSNINQEVDATTVRSEVQSTNGNQTVPKTEETKNECKVSKEESKL